jgi:hypothetical protein
MDRCYLRSPHDVEGDGLVGVAAEAADFKVDVTGIERIAIITRTRSYRVTSKTTVAKVARTINAVTIMPSPLSVSVG